MRITFNALALAMAFAAAPAVAQVPCFVTPFGAIVGSGDDAVLPVQTLGFSFPFNGTTYDRIYPVTNGFCYLGNAASPVPDFIAVLQWLCSDYGRRPESNALPVL